MKCTPLEIPGACLVELEPRMDARGFFARSYCFDELKRAGIEFPVVQCSVSFNHAKQTLRGMHYQQDPCPEMKLVRCTAGSIWDCIVDLRPQSPAFRHWFGIELSARNHQALLIPPRCAHGFLTLTDNAEVFYMMSDPYAPSYARGVRWNDPAFGIQWPAEPLVMSDLDRTYQDFA